MAPTVQVWSSQGLYLRCLGQGDEGLPGISSPAAIMLSPKGRRLAILDAGDNRWDQIMLEFIANMQFKIGTKAKGFFLLEITQ